MASSTHTQCGKKWQEGGRCLNLCCSVNVATADPAAGASASAVSGDGRSSSRVRSKAAGAFCGLFIAKVSGESLPSLPLHTK